MKQLLTELKKFAKKKVFPFAKLLLAEESRPQRFMI